MRVFEFIGIVVLAFIALLVLLFVRRWVIVRGGGTIELSFRISTMVNGRGWAPGIGRFVDDELWWYRMFSFSFRPRRVLSRRDLTVEGRRQPDGPERLALPADWMIVRCTGRRAPVEIAMAHSTLTGFLSWIEAAPPGAASTHLAAS